MTQPIYTPTFQHKDWIDFVDSVQAGGTNGINIRFHGIEAEFTAIQAAFNLLSQAPAAVSQTMTLAPALTATASAPWSQALGLVTTPTIGSGQYATTATGFMPVTLPNGATVQSLRATGASAGGTIIVILYSQPLVGGSDVTVAQAAETLTNVSQAAPFDISSAKNVNIVVDNVANKYFLVATLANGNPALTALGTSLYAFQIGYSAA